MFAAYANQANDKKSVSEETKGKDEQKQNDWLSNSSFAVNSDLVSHIQGSSDRRKEGTLHDRTKPLSETNTFNVDPSTPLGSPSDSEGSSSSRIEAATPPNTPPPSPTNQTCVQIHSCESESEDETTVKKRSEVNDIESEVNLKYDRGEGKDKRRRQSQSSGYRRSRSLSEGRSRSTDRSRRQSHKEEGRSRRRTRSRSNIRSNVEKHTKKSHSRERKERTKHRKRSRERRKRSSSSSSSYENSYNDVGLKEISNLQSQIFYEDKTRAFGNLNVTTLSRPAVAWYHCSRNGLGLSRYTHTSQPSKKKTLKQRYYNKILKQMEADLTTAKVSKENEGQSNVKIGQIQGNVTDVEDELSKATAKFNQDLAADPKNIGLWRKYVEFQDVVHQFERVYRKGGGASGIRVTAERKLSILDKALKENPLCEELLKERCLLAETVLSSDKVTSQLKSWIGTDPGNLVLWESLIMLSQGSLSSCRVPAVKSLYQEALKSINNIKRGNSESIKTVEGKLINLVLHLGLFLRQAGLLELMWSLINVYLEFNLAKLDPTKFLITSTIADNALTELEEAILRSQLPLPTLWLRVETLRAGTHWVPLPADADCEDPQRLVFPEDVNDLIHPINSPHLSFRLVTVTLTLLKVPLLPWRESAARAAGLDPLPWLLDGPETLYACLLPFGTLEFKETSALLMDASQLATGPQFLIARPGQDEYIDFLTQVFSSCCGCLSPTQQTYLLIWWLRFYRWLMQLERLGHCKLPRGRKKKMRSTAKDLLRQDCNRSNLLLFKEFALLELENTSVESAKKVLQGAIAVLPVTKPVPIAPDRASICSLYRTLVEVHLSLNHFNDTEQAESSQKSDEDFKTENRNKALGLLVSLGRGVVLSDEKPSSTDIAAALSKFHHVAEEALNKPTEEELDPFIAPDVCHLAPIFLVEWTACHGWLLFLSHSIWKAAAMFERVLSELLVTQCSESDSSDNGSSSVHDDFVKLQRECLHEAYASLLRHHCHETRGSFGVLRDAILRGLKEFPGNLTLTAALADLETSNSGTGMPLWRLSKMFYELNSAPAFALFVFVMRYRLKQQESAAHNAIIFLNPGGPQLPDPNVRIRMSTLLKKLTKHPIMRRCPLLWRLRLQFAAAISSEDSECYRTFYLALEDCPWAKALYMDIVQVLPAQLAQVQDLLVEKELRLHVTPEELEILRVDS